MAPRKYVVIIQTIQGQQDNILKEWQANVKLAYAQYRKFKMGKLHFQDWYKQCIIPLKPCIIKPGNSESHLINFPLSLNLADRTAKVRYIKKHDVRIKFLPVLYANLNSEEADTIGLTKPISIGEAAEVSEKREEDPGAPS
jgi:hypothetical protein